MQRKNFTLIKEEDGARARRYIKIFPDLAQRWGVSRSTAYRLAGRVLPVLKIGQNRLVNLSDVEAYEVKNTGFDGGGND